MLSPAAGDFTSRAAKIQHRQSVSFSSDDILLTSGPGDFTVKPAKTRRRQSVSFSAEGRGSIGNIPAMPTRSTKGLQSLLLEMERINSRADQASSDWLQICREGNNTDITAQATKETIERWFKVHQDVDQRKSELLKSVRDWMCNAATTGPEMDTRVAEMELSNELQSMIEEINSSAGRAIASASKAANGVGGVMKKLQSVLNIAAKQGKKLKELPTLLAFEAEVNQLKTLIAALNADKAQAENTLQLAHNRIIGVENKWVEDRQKKDAVIKDQEIKIKVLEMTVSNMDKRARLAEQNSRDFVKMKGKAQAEEASMYVELLEKYNSLYAAHEELEAKYEAVIAQLRDVFSDGELAKQTLMMQEGSVLRVRKLEQEMAELRKRLVETRNNGEEERDKLQSDVNAKDEEMKTLKEQLQAKILELEDFRSMHAKSGSEKEAELLKRMVTLEAQLQGKERAHERKIADAKRAQEAEVQRLKSGFEAKRRELEDEVIKTVEQWQERMHEADQRLEDVSKEFRRQINEADEAHKKQLEEERQKSKKRPSARLQGQDGSPDTAASPSRVAELEEELEMLQLKEQQSKWELSDMETRVAEMSITVSKLTAEVDVMRSQLDSQHDSLADMKKQLGETNNQLLDSRIQLADAKSQLFDTRGALEAKEKELLVAHKEKATLVKEIDRLNNELKDAQKLITEAEDRLQEARMRQQDLKQQLDANLQVMEIMEQEYESSQTQMETMAQTQLASAEAETKNTTELEVQLLEARTTIERVQEEAKVTKGALAESQARMATLESEVTQLRNEKEPLRRSESVRSTPKASRRNLLRPHGAPRESSVQKDMDHEVANVSTQQPERGTSESQTSETEVTDEGSVTDSAFIVHEAGEADAVGSTGDKAGRSPSQIQRGDSSRPASPGTETMLPTVVTADDSVVDAAARKKRRDDKKREEVHVQKLQDQLNGLKVRYTRLRSCYEQALIHVAGLKKPVEGQEELIRHLSSRLSEGQVQQAMADFTWRALGSVAPDGVFSSDEEKDELLIEVMEMAVERSGVKPLPPVAGEADLVENLQGLSKPAINEAIYDYRRQAVATLGDRDEAALLSMSLSVDNYKELRQSVVEDTWIKSYLFTPEQEAPGEPELVSKLEVQDDTHREESVSEYRRRALSFAPDGDFNDERQMQALLDKVETRAQRRRVPSKEESEVEDEMRQQLAMLTQEQQLEAVINLRVRGDKALKAAEAVQQNVAGDEDAAEVDSMEVLRRVMKHTVAVAKLQAEQEARRPSPRGETETPPEQPKVTRALTQRQLMLQIEAEEHEAVAAAAAAEDVEDAPVVAAAAKKHTPKVKAGRHKSESKAKATAAHHKKGPVRPTAKKHVEIQVDMPQQRPICGDFAAQADTIPWELIRYPDSSQFQWESELLDTFRKNGRVLRNYVKNAMEIMWNTQDKVVSALNGAVNYVEVEYELREMETALAALIEEGKQSVAQLFESNFGVTEEEDKDFVARLLYGTLTRPGASHRRESVGTQTVSMTKDQNTQATQLSEAAVTQTTKQDMRLLLRDLMVIFPKELPSLEEEAVGSPKGKTKTPKAMSLVVAPDMVSVEVGTDQAMELEYLRGWAAVQEGEARKRRKSEEEHARKLKAQEDRKRKAVDYGMPVKGGDLRSTSWSIAVIQRMLECLKQEYEENPRNQDKLMYTRKALLAKKERLWDHMNTYALKDKVAFMGNLRRLLHSVYMARRLKEQKDQSNRMLLQFMGETENVEKMMALDPFRTALVQLFVLKVAIEKQGGWHRLLYGPNQVADASMSVTEWPIKEQLLILEEIRDVQRRRVSELEQREHELQLQNHVDQTAVESLQQSLREAKELEKKLVAGLALEQTKAEHLQDQVISLTARLAAANASAQGGNEAMLQAGDLLNRQLKSPKAKSLQLVIPGAPKQPERKPAKLTAVVQSLINKHKAETAPSISTASNNVPTSPLSVASDEMGSWGGDRDVKPHSKHKVASPKLRRTGSSLSLTSESSSTRRERMLRDASTGDLLRRKGDSSDDDSSTSKSLAMDELMKEREAVAALHQVLLDTLRALCYMCGIKPSPLGSPRAHEQSVDHPNRVISDIEVDDGGVDQSMDTKREYMLNQRMKKGMASDTTQPHDRKPGDSEASSMLEGHVRMDEAAVHLPGLDFALVPSADRIKMVVDKMKNRETVLAAEDVASVMVTDTKRLLAVLHIIQDKMKEKDKRYSDSFSGKDAEIRVLVDQHLVLKRELGRLRADYISEEAEATIKSLRHHCLVSEREVERLNARLKLIHECVESRGSLVVLADVVKKSQSLMAQLKSLKSREEEVHKRLAEVKKRLLILGPDPEPQEGETKSQQRMVLIKAIESLEKEVEHMQYRQKLLMSEKDFTINCAAEIFERIDRLAQCVFNSTSFRSFLEWARGRDFAVRTGGALKPLSTGPSGLATLTSPQSDQRQQQQQQQPQPSSSSSIVSAWSGDYANKAIANKTRRVDADLIISEIHGMLTYDPDCAYVPDERSPETLAALIGASRGAGAHSAHTKVARGALSPSSHRTRPYTTLPYDDEMSLASSMTGATMESALTLPYIHNPLQSAGDMRSNRGFPMSVKTPSLAQRIGEGEEKAMVRRRHSSARKR